MTKNKDDEPRYQYGQLIPVETPGMWEDILRQVDEEVEKLPEEVSYWLKIAKERCPEQINDAFKKIFVRSDPFIPKSAAKRLAKYWEKRVEICGEDKAFLPMTLNGVCKDDWETFKIPLVRYLPTVKDPLGRALVFFTPALLDSRLYTHESMIRVIWYNLHAALESETAQKYGVLIVAESKGCGLAQFDRIFLSKLCRSLVGAFPMRMTAVHILRPPPTIRIVIPFFFLFLTDRLKKRVLLHFGTEKKYFQALSEYGIDRDMIPVEGDGALDFDQMAWLESRKAEGK